MTDAIRDQNHVPVALGVSSASATTTLPFTIDSVTGRLLTDVAGGSGTVTSVSVVSANGFAGSVVNATTTPAITISTTINSPVLAGNGTAISAATTTGSGSTVVLATGPTFPTNITVGAAAGATGDILLKGTTSGTVTLTVADAAGTWQLTLPTTDGGAGEFLQTDGAGVTTWAAVSAAAGGNNTEVQYNNAGALGGITNATSNGTTLTITSGRATTDFSPSSNDGAALGTTALGFADLHLATGGVINWANGEVTITETNSNLLTFAGGAYAFSGAITGTTSLTLGVAAGATGSVVLTGTTSGAVTLSVADAAGTWTMKLPTTDGNANEFLQTDGSGNTTWAAGSSIPATTITVANEATDTTCFPVFVTAATGDLGPKSNVGLTFNSNTASLGATLMTATTSLTSATIRASSNDSGSLGASGTAFSDLFLASGALIDFAAGNSVITHSSAVLTVSTGDLRVTTAGTNTASAVTVGGTQTLTNKTLTSPAVTTGTYTGTQLLAEGASVGLDPALSADGTWTGITMTGTAGYTQAFGDLVYLDPTDSRWEAADADVSTAADGDPRGILAMVVVAGTDGNACTLLLQGVIRADTAFPAMTVNAAMYVGETAGDIQATIPTGADNVIRVVGQALTADTLYFNPSQDWQITVA